MTPTGTPPAWSALPPAVRAQVVARARQGLPHPDPGVRAAVVVERRRRREFAFRLASAAMLSFAAVAVAASVLIGLFGLFADDRTPGVVVFGAMLVFVVICLPAAVLMFWSAGYNLVLHGTRRIESANVVQALADRRQPGTAPVAGHARGFRQPGAVSLALLVLIPIPVCLGLARFTSVYEEGGAAWVIPVVTGVLITIPLLLIAYAQAQLTPFRGVVAEFTTDGVRLPALGLDLGWAEVARIEAVDFQQTLCCTVVPRDPAAVAARSTAPWLRRAILRWQLRNKGAAYLPAAWMRGPVDEIVAGAQALHLTVLAGTTA
ncbi:hypothetical protein [Hamadaea tsunoensis]|uniref:hypothetical protein n=1 Tax=Hamadaea tsunoensis TaxID=53368 RepID=UPI0012F8A7E5|nr:hypothetical protein [Hamadaea tsunoensis]